MKLNVCLFKPKKLQSLRMKFWDVKENESYKTEKQEVQILLKGNLFAFIMSEIVPLSTVLITLHKKIANLILGRHWNQY